jgi:hypothetical protein
MRQSGSLPDQPAGRPRSVALLFDKPTLRTQASFSAGIAELGGFPMIVDGRLAGIGRGSPWPTPHGCSVGRRGDGLADLRQSDSRRWPRTPACR